MARTLSSARDRDRPRATVPRLATFMLINLYTAFISSHVQLVSMNHANSAACFLSRVKERVLIVMPTKIRQKVKI
jgi:hypothetical protein